MVFCLVCETRAVPNSGAIHVILLISCGFHFWVGQSHPALSSIWWLVQQQEQIVLLGWSQGMVAANKLLLLSDPCLCVYMSLFSCVSMWMGICVFMCACACVHDPEWLLSNKEMKSIVSPHPPPPANHCLLLLHLHFLEPLGVLPHWKPQTSIGSIYLVDRSAEWLLLLSRPHKNHGN